LSDLQFTDKKTRKLLNPICCRKGGAGTIKVLCLGRFHSIDEEYPRGYKSSRQFYLYSNPEKSVAYISTVVSQSHFEVHAEGHNKVFTGKTATYAWKKLINEVNLHMVYIYNLTKLIIVK